MQERQSVEKHLQRSSAQLRRLAEHQANVKEEERKRIAREIHDDLGQSLLALRIDLSVMSNTVDAAPIRDHLAEALRKVDLAMKAVKMIINDLRPAMLDLGLHAAVEWEVKKFHRQTGGAAISISIMTSSVSTISAPRRCSALPRNR
jgi:signal transduction histidine kinase